MIQIALLLDKVKSAIYMAGIAFLIGIALIVSDISRNVVVGLTMALPILYFMWLRPYVFILKCMLLVVFFIPFQFYDFLNLYNVVNPLIVLGLILVAKFFLSESIRKRPSAFEITAVDKIYFVFLFSALISSFIAISILGSLNWLFYSVTTGYFVYRAILTLHFHEVKSLLKFLIIVSSLSALYGIGEYVANYSLIYGRVIVGRLTSLLGHPVVNGLIFATVLPLSIIMFYETRAKVFIATSVVLVFAVVLTFSRGSWLSLLIGLVVMFVLMRPKLKMIMIVILVALGVVIGLIPDLRQAVLNRYKQSEVARYSSFGVRFEGIPIAFSIMKDRPFFGGGPHNATRFKELYSHDVNLIDICFENSYLGLMVGLGFIGIAILVFLFITIGKTIFLSLLRDDRLKIYKVASFTSLLVLLINAATFNFDDSRLFHFIIWFYIGLNIVFSKHDLNKSS